MSLCAACYVRSIFFQHLTHDFTFLFNRLIRVCVCPQRNRARLIIWMRKLLAKLLSRIRPRDEFRFKIKTRRKPEERVARACKAINTSMLAATIWVDRAIKREVWRGVPGDDFPGDLIADFGPQDRQRFVTCPTIINHFCVQSIKAHIRI